MTLAREEVRRPPEGPAGPLPPASRRLRLPGPVVRVLLWSAAGLLVLGALSAIPALTMRGHLQRGRDALSEAQEALLAGELERAGVAFARAEAAFSRAEGQPTNVVLRVAALLPVAGRTPDALLELAQIGRQLSSAGEDLAREVAALPGGLRSLGPSDGRLPIEILSSLSPTVSRANRAIQDAKRRADRLPDMWLVGPVAEARDFVREKLATAAPLSAAAEAMIRSLPEFAGQHETKRYFVAPQNLAELRGTGGLIGNFAVLTIEDGKLSFGEFVDTGHNLRDLPVRRVDPPSPEFSEIYDPFGGAGFWLNLNMTPDVPTVATLIENLYEQVRGAGLDGVVFVDLVAFAEMLEVTGPVDVPVLDATLTAENVVDFVASAAYRGDEGELEYVGPGLVAAAVWDRFLTTAPPEEALRALVGAAAGGHLMFHSADPDVQRAFRLAGVAGDFTPGPGDFFSAIVTNAAGNKVDYFTGRHVRYEVALGDDGTGRAEASVTFENDAPAGQEPSYTLGPYELTDALVHLNLQPGENRSWTSFYCAPGCRLVEAAENGGHVDLETHREYGVPMYANFFRVQAQQTTTVDLDLELDRAWEGDAGGGSYRLRLRGQPTIRPTTATVVVRAPEGMNIAWTSEPMDVDGGVAVWRGHLDQVQDLEVRFNRPLVTRTWARIWDFLTTPAIRL